jgi:tetratricopeptide (TPR) repeat protein
MEEITRIISEIKDLLSLGNLSMAIEQLAGKLDEGIIKNKTSELKREFRQNKKDHALGLITLESYQVFQVATTYKILTLLDEWQYLQNREIADHIKACKEEDFYNLDMEAALQVVYALKEKYPRYLHARILEIKLYCDLERYDEALDGINYILDQYNFHAEAMVFLGYVKGKTGNYRESLRLFDKALKIDPYNDDCYAYRGILKEENGLYDAAIVDYEQSILLKPHENWVYTTKGSCYYAIGNYPQAVESYQTAIRQNAKNYFARFGLGMTYAAQEQWGLCMEELEKLAREVPKVPDHQDYQIQVYYFLALASYELHDFDKTYHYLKKVDAFESELFRQDKLELYGLMYWALGDFENAAIYFKQSVTGASNDRKLMLLYHQLECRTILNEDASWEIEEMLRIQPVTHTDHTYHGVAHFRNNEIDKAKALFAQAIRLGGDDPFPYLRLGDIGYNEQKYDSALKFYEKALIFDRNSEDAYTGQSSCYLQKKDYANALLYAEKCLSLFPQNLRCRHNKLDVLVAKRKYKDAADFYNHNFSAEHFNDFQHSMARGGLNLLANNLSLAKEAFKDAFNVAPNPKEAENLKNIISALDTSFGVSWVKTIFKGYLFFTS